ncbi:DeoR family transcriptional regulator [Catenulispora sp. GAS73]|uniref:DeoR family transcriptional regulator n=1 Tax=Catenulispora sp. GAS73 TaxID=3156269 RepID=UPI003515A932
MDVATVARELGVCVATIRLDLTQLNDQDLLVRTRGGAAGRWAETWPTSCRSATISAASGLSAHDEFEAHTNAVIIAARARGVAVADGSKIGRAHLGPCRGPGRDRRTGHRHQRWPLRSAGHRSPGRRGANLRAVTALNGQK